MCKLNLKKWKIKKLASWIRKRKNETTHQKQPRGLIAKGNSKKKKERKKGKLKASWIQKRKKQTRPQIF